MTDKPHACFALPGHHVVALQGRDAMNFAQAQFMSDVKSLADGQWHWSGWLTPKGRVVALFALLRRDAETVWLVVPDADAEALAEGLRRFVFRSKVAISVLDAPVSAAFVEPTHGRLEPADARGWLGLAGDVVALDMSGEGGPRTLLVGGEPAAFDPAAVARWAAADLAHGLPRLPASQADAWTPQQLSLERLRAFSVKKGCYPGQEIVARTHFLGKAKRGLALLEAGATAAVGSDVLAGGAAIGTVVSAAGSRALAVLPLERDATPLSVDGMAVDERPLLGGLER